MNVGPLTVERRGPRVQNGRGGFDAAPATNVVFDPIAAHNVDGRDLEQVPEADRNSEIVQFYPIERMFTAADGFTPDVVLYNSRRYRIVKVRDFNIQGGVYCAFGALEDPQAQA